MLWHALSHQIHPDYSQQIYLPHALFYPDLAPFSYRKRYKFLQWQEQEIKTVSTNDRDPLIFITNVLDHLASKNLKSIP